MGTYEADYRIPISSFKGVDFFEEYVQKQV